MTFCNVGGVIGTLTSGQNPGEEMLSREEEIERAIKFFREISEQNLETDGWRAGRLSDERLRELARRNPRNGGSMGKKWSFPRPERRSIFIHYTTRCCRCESSWKSDYNLSESIF